MEAIDIYNKLLTQDANNIQVYRNLGKAYKQIKEYRQAIEIYNRVLELNPKESQAYNNRGLAHYALDEYWKAIADFNDAISLEPKNIQLYCNRGKAYRQLREYQKALEDFELVLEFDPNYSLAKNEHTNVLQLLKGQWLEEGNALFSTKGPHEAIAYFDRALELDPKNLHLYYNRGLAYFALNEYLRAMADLIVHLS